MSVVPAEVLPGSALAAQEPVREAAELGPRARLWPALAAVYRAQLSRARVARIPLLFVATFQSIGIMILMRGVVDGGGEAQAVVAGSSVLGLLAFVALNLLAQYFGQLRASGGLDHYATLPGAPGGGGAGRGGRVRVLHGAGDRGDRGVRLRAVRAAAGAPVGPGGRHPAARVSSDEGSDGRVRMIAVSERRSFSSSRSREAVSGAWSRRCFVGMSSIIAAATR
ncbi:hypothetical protein SALBM311S_09282 [Streptomyces alboniger]